MDKLRGFRHFIRNAYDVELSEDEIALVMTLLNQHFSQLLSDFEKFHEYVVELSA